MVLLLYRARHKRRTLGSYMAMGNKSLHMIGKALGHRSHISTQIYARLANDPVRQAKEKVQADMMVAAELVSNDEPVETVVAKKSKSRRPGTTRNPNSRR